jgi:acetyl-CoA acetyltransferase
VLIAHGESGRSGVGRGPFSVNRSSLPGQFELPYGVAGPTSNFTIPVLRYMKERGVTEEDLARVAVVQREWAAMNPRASRKAPITVDDVLNSEMIAWPFRKLMCCLRTDGGGALILTSADRAKDFPTKPVYVMGTGEALGAPGVSMMEDHATFGGFRRSGADAFAEAGIARSDVDHLMVYDAFASLPLYALEDLGFCEPGEAKDFFRERRTAPGGALPMNTNGGGLSYMHSGMYGMYAMQESVRQLRGTAAAQVPGAKISVCQGVGGMFNASGTVIFTNAA